MRGRGGECLWKVEELFDISHGRLQSSTVLASNGKEYFGMDEYKYLITISFLRSVQLVLNNGNADRPTKEQARIITDVVHEISDMHAQSEEEKEKNEEIAVAIKCLIDILE